VVIVDGAAIDVQPVACGWLSTRSSPRRYPLESSENSTHDFRLNAVAPVGEGGAFIIDLDADYTPGLEVIFLSVARAVPNDLGGTYIWSNERESAHRVEVTGNRIRTVDALHVLEDSTDVRSAEHEVTIDVVCETFGGALDDATQLAAEILGIDLPEPGGDATVTVDDLDYPLSVTACDTTADGTELTAESDDGAIALSLIDGPLSDVVFVGFHGKRWIRDRDVEILVDGNHFASDGPVELFDQFTGESVGMVQFEAICG
jgi:hypothetical protein